MISVWLVKHTIHLFPFLKTKNRDFNSYVAIQKVIHNIRQKKYQMYFKQLHENLILLILKISSEPSGIIPKINNLKIKIIIDDKKGIFKADNDKLTYPIERKSKRMTIIKHLLTKDTISLHELMTITGQTDTVVMKSITEINQLFREKLKVAYDLILKNPTGGYSLNKTDFDIRVN
jgi:hypothetical protein